MGTRADFYVGRGEGAEWIGSIAWDGYPGGFEPELFVADDEGTWRHRVAKMIAGREDGTKPEDGWPWPWNDSGTTDYAYAFDGGKVYATTGSAWWPALGERPEREDGRVLFPDMSGRKAVTLGRRSGLIILGG